MSETTAPPLTIVEFIEARLSEAEADHTLPRPHRFGDADVWHGTHRHDCACLILSGIGTHDMDCDCGEPARVLREIAAKRAIIADCRKVLDETSREVSVQTIWLAGRTLLKTAEPYASHGDYDPERWAGERPAAWDEWVFNG